MSFVVLLVTIFQEQINDYPLPPPPPSSQQGSHNFLTDMMCRYKSSSASSHLNKLLTSFSLHKEIIRPSLPRFSLMMTTLGRRHSSTSEYMFGQNSRKTLPNFTCACLPLSNRTLLSHTRCFVTSYGPHKGHYDVLGVKKSDSVDVIKKAYYVLAMKFHPDTSDAPQSGEMFQRVQEAYEVLSDPTKRSDYDRTLSTSSGSGGGGGREGGRNTWSSSESRYEKPRYREWKPHYTHYDEYSSKSWKEYQRWKGRKPSRPPGDDFEDYLRWLLRNEKKGNDRDRSKNQRAQTKNEDTRSSKRENMKRRQHGGRIQVDEHFVNINLTRMEAKHGGMKEVVVETSILCNKCKGKKLAPKKCRKCNGTGEMCTYCRGRGETGFQACSGCRGSGVSGRASHDIDIPIPVGVRNDFVYDFTWQVPGEAKTRTLVVTFKIRRTKNF